MTPSFNQGRYIEQTIQSVLSQNYPNLEYIIIDGGSTDDTLGIIKKYEKRLTYWVSEPDKGQTDAINKGYEKCTGEIFNWINSDDYYEPDTFHKLLSHFTDMSVNVVCGREWGFKNDNPAEKILSSGSVLKKNVFESIRIGIIDQPCTFFRKKCIDNLFPLDISLKYVMDRQLWWAYLLKYDQGNIKQTGDVFTNFRLHSRSKSVLEGEMFEEEFDRLKLTLFRQLQLPVIIEKQLHQNIAPLNSSWQIRVEPVDLISASFASFYAQANYVKNDIRSVSTLMQLVRKWKNWSMDKKEWKLWLVSSILPASLVAKAKQIKSKLSFGYCF